MMKRNLIDRIANFLLPSIASLTPRGAATLDLVPARKAPQISVPVSAGAVLGGPPLSDRRAIENLSQRNERRLSKVFEEIRSEEPNILKILLGTD